MVKRSLFIAQFITQFYSERKWMRFLGGFIVGLWMVTGLCFLGGINEPAASVDAELRSPLNQAQIAYESGNLEDAATLLTRLIQIAQANGNTLERAIAQSNLALVRGQQGQWNVANPLITESIALLSASSSSTGYSVERAVLAQTLNIQGRIELGQGRADAAYHTWGQSAEMFQGMGDRQGELRSRIRQAQALQAQGYARRAVDDILRPLEARLRNAPPSSTTVIGLLTLGEALQTVDSLDAARRVTDDALRMAEQIQDRGAIAASHLDLGNIAYAQAKATHHLNRTTNLYETARNHYAQTLQNSGSGSSPHMSALVNSFSLLVESAATSEDAADAVTFWQTTVFPETEGFAVSREGIYARLNLVHHLSCLKRPETCEQSFAPSDSPSWDAIAGMLTTAQQQAAILNDTRAMAYVSGYWGAFYDHTGQPTPALQATEQALVLAKSVNAPDMAYRWYDQLGHLLEQRGDKERAIAAYTGAVQTLKTLRSDLTAVNPEVQFSFNDSIDPIHRKLVNLLLTPPPGQPDNPDNLERARQVIESLQLEELNNFLQAACLDTQDDISLDEIADEQQVAIIYPIILPNRVEIIVRFPQQPLRRYTSFVSETELTRLGDRLRQTLGDQFYSISLDFLSPATEMYTLLIEPLAADLAAAQPETLVFVLDGVLRNIPMAALFDGERYLMEQYAIAVVPGLQLVDPQPLQNQRLQALTFGLTEGRQGFSELPNVENELTAIGNTITSKTWINEAFTRSQFETTVSRDSDPIVHLATHGQFSSNLDETFILSWDEKILVNDLSLWISDRDRPIELLVLSACETAAGDQRAALGLAGMAVRAGARSTLASLWRVDDAATFEIMQQFYQELSTTPGISKAKALQKAQQFILGDRPEFEHPYYWAPFILVGNWL